MNKKIKSMIFIQIFTHIYSPQKFTLNYNQPKLIKYVYGNTHK